MKAWLNLRYTVPERRAVFESGLKRLGYQIASGVTASPGPRDIFVTWNRIGEGDRCARLFESLGLPVLVTENAIWGKDFAGRRWYSLAHNYHNHAGRFPVGDAARWDSLGVQLQPFRTEGETVILPQRGIGSPPVAMPKEWPALALQRHGGRVRPHPGRGEGIPIERDLRHCGSVITWGSGAAVKALTMGIPVVSEMPNWIAEQNNTEVGRLAMFRRLAWAQRTLEEFETGEAFDWLLKSPA